MAIIVLSLNTAIDRTLQVTGFRTGAISRAERSGAFAGGKALNVARVLRQLAEPVTVVGFLGGAAAPFIRERCEAIGIEQWWVEIAGETRSCVVIVDPETDAQTVVNEEGPRITPAEVHSLREEIARRVGVGDILCISGSAPPGAPTGFYGEIAADLGRRGVRVLADLRGAELASVALARPWAVTPNLEEARSAFGDTAGPREMARALAQHAEHAVLTLGKDGVMYASGEQITQLKPPKMGVVNAVASGDALAAGFLAGMNRELPALDAVRLGVACGASNASRFEPGIGSLQEVGQLMTQVVSHEL